MGSICTECLKKMKETKISIKRYFYKCDVIIHNVPVLLCKCGEYRIKSEYVDKFIRLADNAYVKRKKHEYEVEVPF